jgi:hypothetical protein
MKKFKIFDTGNNRFVLYVNPERVTIKIQTGSSEEHKTRVINFLKWVSQQPELSEYDIEYRGRTSIPPHKEQHLLIQMIDSSGRFKHTFREANMGNNS